MAKRKTGKRSATRSVSGSANDHNAFIMILGGGFVVVLLILYFLNKPGSLFSLKNSTPNLDNSAVPVEVMEQVEQNVVIEGYTFPETITVKAGEKVTWTNEDLDAHTVTADDGSFDTGVLANGENGSVIFDTPGTYTYTCTLHPYMTGTVVVEE